MISLAAHIFRFFREEQQKRDTCKAIAVFFLANHISGKSATRVFIESVLRNYTTQPDSMIGEGAFFPTPVIPKKTINQSASEDNIVRTRFGKHLVALCSNHATALKGNDQFVARVYNDGFRTSIPIQVRRTYVMSHNSKLMVFISETIQVAARFAQFILPTPVHAKVAFAGTVGYIAHAGGQITLASVLNMAIPNMKGGGNRQRVGGGHSTKSTVPNLAVVKHVGNKAKRSASGGMIDEPRDRSNDWPTRQLWVDAATAEHIKDLVVAIEAKGVSELIRRALRAREDFHPDEAEAKELDGTISLLKANKEGETRLNITLPPTSWDRVDRLKKNTGNSFRTLVYEAIIIFAELHERSKDDGDKVGRVYLY